MMRVKEESHSLKQKHLFKFKVREQVGFQKMGIPILIPISHCQPLIRPKSITKPLL